MRLIKASKSADRDDNGALHAICSTGRGRCWHCDRKLPAAEEAIGAGWYVQRVDGHSVASIILVCPKCRRKRSDGARKQLMRRSSPPACGAVQ